MTTNAISPNQLLNGGCRSVIRTYNNGRVEQDGTARTRLSCAPDSASDDDVTAEDNSCNRYTLSHINCRKHFKTFLILWIFLFRLEIGIINILY